MSHTDSAGRAIAAGRACDTLGHPVAEGGRRDDLHMTAIAENKSLKLVVDHHFERNLYTAVAKSLLHFLRLVEWLRLHLGSLLGIHLDHHSAGAVVNSFGDAYSIVKKVLGIEVNTLFERMLFVDSHGMNTVKSENINLRRAV